MDQASANSAAQSFLSLRTVDELIRQRAQDSDQRPLVVFSASEHGLMDFEQFTGLDLDRFTDAAAKVLISRGLQPVVRSA